MADAVLLELLTHLNGHPPALISHAPLGAADDALGQALDRYLDLQEIATKRWADESEELKRKLWKQVADGVADVTLDNIEDLIGMLERSIRSLERAKAKHERRMRAIERDLPSEKSAGFQKNSRRIVHHAEIIGGAAQDMLLFLRAVRSELDPSSRSGPAFDDPSSLEAYLLAHTA